MKNKLSPSAPKPEIDVLENYLTITKASIGSKMFRKLYVRMNGKKKDILNNGELSCAFFVSCILTLVGFLKQPHATVTSTAEQLKKNGWKEVAVPTPGAIVVWAAKQYKNGSHRHIGIVVEKEFAISNSSTARTPLKHKINYRPVEYFLEFPKLKSDVA